MMLSSSLWTRRHFISSAWAVPSPLQRGNISKWCPSFSSLSSRPLIRHASRDLRWRCSVTSKPSLSVDELAVVEATARVTHYLSQGNLTAVSTFDLFAFFSVKGLGVIANIWDRVALEEAVLRYARLERLSRVRNGDDWDAMSAAEKIRVLHDVCNAEGDVTYIDPESGYTVFTFFAHLKRGYCCGIKLLDEEGEDGKLYERTHRCRHCPYTEPGELKSAKMRALGKRVSVIEYARERAQQMWMEGGGTSTGISFGTMGEYREATSEADAEGGTVSPLRAERDEAALKRRFARVVNIEKPENRSGNCAECGDEQIVTCKRCNGFTYLFSPQTMKCPQCEAKGFHPCMNCTPFRPPPRSSFYS